MEQRERGESAQLRRRVARSVASVAVAVGAVLAFRWTLRAAMTRAYRAGRDVSAPEAPLAAAPRVHSLAALVHRDLHVNIAGFAVRRRAELLHLPYSLAADVAEDKASSAGWERLDEPGALTVKNLSGMERLYRTPEGSIVLRELRAVRGDDTLMEDFVIPAELLPAPEECATPDDLSRRSARRVKDLLPAVLRGVVAGSPMFTQLVERGGGAAFIVHSLADLPAAEAVRAVEEAARADGWRESPRAGAGGESPRKWTKDNLTFHFEAVPRAGGAGTDLDYRFSDDEVLLQKKGKEDED